MSKYEGHTPGPWRVQIEPVQHGSKKQGYTIVTDAFDVVSGHLLIRKKADAALIADAPTLLSERDKYKAMCEELVEALEEINDANQVNRLGSDGEITAMNISEAALAKAKEFDDE